MVRHDESAGVTDGRARVCFAARSEGRSRTRACASSGARKKRRGRGHRDSTESAGRNRVDLMMPCAGCARARARPPCPGLICALQCQRLGERREPFNSTPNGGQFDFVRLPARTTHTHGACVWRDQRNQEKHPPERHCRSFTSTGERRDARRGQHGAPPGDAPRRLTHPTRARTHLAHAAHAVTTARAPHRTACTHTHAPRPHRRTRSQPPPPGHRTTRTRTREPVPDTVFGAASCPRRRLCEKEHPPVHCRERTLVHAAVSERPARPMPGLSHFCPTFQCDWCCPARQPCDLAGQH